MEKFKRTIWDKKFLKETFVKFLVNVFGGNWIINLLSDLRGRFHAIKFMEVDLMMTQTTNRVNIEQSSATEILQKHTFFNFRWSFFKQDNHKLYKRPNQMGSKYQIKWVFHV